MREKGTKHRTLEMTHQGTTGDGRPKSSLENIGEMFKKGVEEVPSSSHHQQRGLLHQFQWCSRTQLQDFQLEKNLDLVGQTHQNH